MKQNTKLVGEFFLIVIGVLVALAVESALEDRADDKLRDQYLSRLKLDMESDVVALEGRIEFFTGVQRFSEDVLHWLKNDEPVGQELLLASFYAAEIWPLTPNKSTYVDLHSTGNLRLLDSIDLRTSMATYYNNSESTDEGMHPSEDYRAWMRGVIPYATQVAIREHCPTTDTQDLQPTGFPPCELSDVDYDQINKLYEPLRGNSEFRQILTYRHSELGVMIYLLGRQVAFAKKAISKIEEQ